MSLITLVTIGWNDIDGLKRTFASLAGQTFRDVQHVVVDGGSADGSADWARANAVFTQTVVVSERDRGIYDAMNKGLRLTHGDLVGFLNSGDCFAASDVLEHVADSYRTEGWQWAFGLSQMVDEAFQPVRRRQLSRYSWLRQTFWQYEVSHQAVFMQTRFIRDMGGFDERFSLAADYHLITRAGRQSRPYLWPRTVALTLEGGVTDRDLAAAHRQIHAARVDALGMGTVASRLDAVWTRFLIIKVRARRAARTLVRALQQRQRRRSQRVGHQP